MTSKKKDHRAAYSKAFKDLDNLIPKQKSGNLKDAKIHEYLINNGRDDHAMISFRTVLGHIQGELKAPKISQDYLAIFGNYSWCKRLKDGLPL